MLLANFGVFMIMATLNYGNFGNLKVIVRVWMFIKSSDFVKCISPFGPFANKLALMNTEEKAFKDREKVFIAYLNPIFRI